MASKNLLPNFREPGLVNREHDSLITQLRAELHTGFQALSMQLASLQAAPPSAPQGDGVDNVHELSPAPDGMIDKTIIEIYDEHAESGSKPPNIKEIALLVQHRLRSKGCYASGLHIQRVADKHKHRRRKPGRTLASENRR